MAGSQLAVLVGLNSRPSASRYTIPPLGHPKGKKNVARPRYQVLFVLDLEQQHQTLQLIFVILDHEKYHLYLTLLLPEINFSLKALILDLPTYFFKKSLHILH